MRIIAFQSWVASSVRSAGLAFGIVSVGSCLASAHRAHRHLSWRDRVTRRARVCLEFLSGLDSYAGAVPRVQAEGK